MQSGWASSIYPLQPSPRPNFIAIHMQIYICMRARPLSVTRSSSSSGAAKYYERYSLPSQLSCCRHHRSSFVTSIFHSKTILYIYIFFFSVPFASDFSSFVYKNMHIQICILFGGCRTYSWRAARQALVMDLVRRAGLHVHTQIWWCEGAGRDLLEGAALCAWRAVRI